MVGWDADEGDRETRLSAGGRERIPDGRNGKKIHDEGRGLMRNETGLLLRVRVGGDVL